MEITPEHLAQIEQLLRLHVDQRTLVGNQQAPLRLSFLQDLFPKQLEILNDPSRKKAIKFGRRFGKCLVENTLVATPKGPCKIQDLQVGDKVYGWNKDDTVSVTTVTDVIDQGMQEVVDLLHRKRVVASCTLEHPWLTTESRVSNSPWIEKKVSEFVDGSTAIARRFVTPSLGDVREPHAYVLGILLGDGCCRQGNNSLSLSSANSQVPMKLASILGCFVYKNSSKNYTWTLSNTPKNYPTHSAPLRPHHYMNWCHGKYAHEKIVDLEVIKTWDRPSCIEFLAGLIDSDGSVYYDGKRLTLSIGMQAKPVIEAVKYLLLALFQVEVTIHEENREKYKNGPIHLIHISNNLYAKRILKTLSPHLVSPQKQWKKEYDNLKEHNTNPDFTGVVVNHESKRLEHCWDITVDNETNLYLLANGLVTHNTRLLASALLKRASIRPQAKCLFLTTSVSNSHRLIWDTLEELDEAYALGLDFNKANSTVSLNNGSCIYLKGCANRREAEKMPGDKWDCVCIDEAQGFPDWLDYLLDEQLGPALEDYKGDLYVVGTTNAAAVGPFYRYTTEENSKFKVWSGLSVLDNPKYPEWRDLPNWQEISQQWWKNFLLENKWTEDSGIVRRQWKAEWVRDENSLVVAFDDKRNTYDTLPVLPEGEEYNYIFGMDMGYKDEFVITVLAHYEHDPVCYIVDVFKESFLTTPRKIEVLKEWKDKYNPKIISTDSGGGGTQFIADIQERYDIEIDIATKTNKLEFVQLFSDEFKEGKIKINSQLTECINEIKILEWSDKAKCKIPESFKQDFFDSCRYGWRASPHYRTTPVPKPEPKPDTQEWIDQYWAEEQANMEEQGTDWRFPDSFF